MPVELHKAVGDLVELLGFKVGLDSKDRRLQQILESEGARKLRRWCGGYTGARGKQQRRQSPRDVNGLCLIFQKLIVAADPSRQEAGREGLKRICQMLEMQEATPATISTVLMIDIGGIVGTLEGLLKSARMSHGDVGLDVVTRSADVHSTMNLCFVPMVERMMVMAQAGEHVRTRIIEQGARLIVMPDATSVNDRLGALVCSTGGEKMLSWHGSLIWVKDSTNVEIPFAAMIGWKDRYYVRVATSSDHNIERELSEKITDFERVWQHLNSPAKLRVWGSARLVDHTPIPSS